MDFHITFCKNVIDIVDIYASHVGRYVANRIVTQTIKLPRKNYINPLNYLISMNGIDLIIYIAALVCLRGGCS